MSILVTLSASTTASDIDLNSGWKEIQATRFSYCRAIFLGLATTSDEENWWSENQIAETKRMAEAFELIAVRLTDQDFVNNQTRKGAREVSPTLDHHEEPDFDPFEKHLYDCVDIMDFELNPHIYDEHMYWRHVEALGGINIIGPNAEADKLLLEADISGQKKFSHAPRLQNSAKALKEVKANLDGYTIDIYFIETLKVRHITNTGVSEVDLPKLEKGTYTVRYLNPRARKEWPKIEKTVLLGTFKVE